MIILFTTILHNSIDLSPNDFSNRAASPKKYANTIYLRIKQMVLAYEFHTRTIVSYLYRHRDLSILIKNKNENKCSYYKNNTGDFDLELFLV